MTTERHSFGHAHGCVKCERQKRDQLSHTIRKKLRHKVSCAATSLAQVIDQVCRSSDRTVTEFLATAGYSESAIRGALNSVFGSVGSFFNDVFDSFSIF